MITSAREAVLDGIYVIRTYLPETSMDTDTAVRTYEPLANVETNFKTPRTRYVGIHPIRH